MAALPTFTPSPVTTDASVPTETAAQFLRAHQVRADVTRSTLTATDDNGSQVSFSVFAGQVDSAPVRAFLGY